MATHKVSRGDSLEGLAKLYYKDPKAAGALAVANRLGTGSVPKAGSTLSLPPRLVYLDSLAGRQAMSTTAVLGIFELRSDLVFVKVREELLGADANQVVTLGGKWLYVASEGVLAARVDMPAEGDWKVENRLFDAQKSAGDETLILLAGREYDFVVSPFELTASTEKRFVERADRFWRAERHAGKPDVARHVEWTILVRDAYQWALDVHRLLYLPALDAYRKWVSDNAPHLFVASTLKCLVEAEDPRWYTRGKDPLCIADHLRPGEPDNYINNVYLKGLDGPRLRAERAMAKLATLLLSEEHHTIELSATEQGKEPLEVTALMWGSVLEFANETLPGRKLLQTIAADAERFPAKCLLTNSPPATWQDSFPQARYVSNASIAVLKDLAPFWLELKQAAASRSKLKQLAGFLSHAAGEDVTALDKSFTQMHHNLVQGVELSRGVKYPNTTRFLLKATPGYTKASDAAKTIEPPSFRLLRNVRLAEGIGKSVTVMGFRGGLESINFGIAYSEWSADRTRRKAAGLVGAAADLSALAADLMGGLLKGMPLVAVRFAGAALGIISGVCDTYEFAQSVNEVSGRHDYDAAVGYGIATAGAGLITVGSTLALYSTAVARLATVEGAAAVGELLSARTIQAIGLGRLGGTVGLLGAALVGAGAVWWQVAKDSDYEQFAGHCFLGRNYPKSFTAGWTSVVFPPPDSGKESTALVQLLSSFRIELLPHSGGGPHQLTLVPGFYGEEDVFEIYLEHRLDAADRRRRAAFLTVHISSGAVWQQSGERLAPSVQVVRSQDARVEKILLSETFAEATYASATPFTARIARVRLRTAQNKFVPHTGEWVEANVFGMQEFDRPQATSSSPADRANLEKSPFARTRAL